MFEENWISELLSRIAGYPILCNFGDKFLKEFPMYGETPSIDEVIYWSKENGFNLSPVECKNVSLSIKLAKVFAGKQ